MIQFASGDVHTVQNRFLFAFQYLITFFLFESVHGRGRYNKLVHVFPPLRFFSFKTAHTELFQCL